MKKSVINVSRIMFVGLILFFGIPLIISFVLADHVITTSTGGMSFSVYEDETNLYNITVNNTGTLATANITQVNITFPDTFSFLVNSNGTDAETHTFTNTSTDLIWANDGLVMNLTWKYFWFNLTASTPGSYNITVTTVNETGSYSSNISVSVNATGNLIGYVKYDNGIGVANYSLQLMKVGGGMNQTNTSSTGYYNFTNVAEGLYSLMYWVEGTVPYDSNSSMEIEIDNETYPNNLVNISGATELNLTIYNITVTTNVSNLNQTQTNYSNGNTLTVQINVTNHEADAINFTFFLEFGDEMDPSSYNSTEEPVQVNSSLTESRTLSVAIPESNTQSSTQVKAGVRDEYNQSYSHGNVLVKRTKAEEQFINVDVPPIEIHLVSPQDGNSTSNNNISFEYNITKIGFQQYSFNCTLVLDGVDNKTDSNNPISIIDAPPNNKYNGTINATLPYGSYNWTIKCNETSTNETVWADENWTLDIVPEGGGEFNLSVEKYTLNSTVNSTQDTIEFIINLTNNGDVDIFNISVNDTSLGMAGGFFYEDNKSDPHEDWFIGDDCVGWNVSNISVNQSYIIHVNFTGSHSGNLTNVVEISNSSGWIMNASGNVTVLYEDEGGYYDSNWSINLTYPINGENFYCDGFNFTLTNVTDSVNCTLWGNWSGWSTKSDSMIYSTDGNYTLYANLIGMVNGSAYSWYINCVNESDPLDSKNSNTEDFIYACGSGGEGFVSLNKTTNVSSADVGELVYFTINITNNENAILNNVTIRDFFDNMDWVFNSSEPNCSESTNCTNWSEGNLNIYEWNLTLNLGENQSYLLNTTLRANSSGIIAFNHVNLTARYNDTSTEFAQSETSVNITSGQSSLSVSVNKTLLNESTIYKGNIVPFLINITNTGTANITNLTIIDHYDTSLNYTNASIEPTEFNNTNRSINWTNILTVNLKPNASQLLYVNLTAIGSASQNFNKVNVTAYDEFGGNTTSFDEVQFSILNDTTPPTFTPIPANTTINYTQGFGVQFNATDETEFDSYAINWTNLFTINSTGYLKNSTANIGVGIYLINITINDTSGNENSIIYQVIVNKSIPEGNLTNDQTWTGDYGTEIVIGLSENQVGDSDVTYVVYRDGVSKGTGETVTLGAGAYNYVLNTTGGVNWTSNASMDTQTLTVTQISSSVNLTLNNTQGNASINEDISINLNCSTISGDSGAYLVLYNSGTLINNGTSPIGNTTLFSEPGNYNITCVYENTQNYTTSSETWWLEVNDTTAPSVTIDTPLNQNYITNSITFNVTATDGTAVDSCWYSLDSGVTNFSMTNIGDDYNATNSSMVQGSHTVNFYCNDSYNNLNNTESVTFFIDSINPSVTLLTETPSGPATYSVGATYEFNATITDTNLQTVLIEFNGTNYTTSNMGGDVYNFSISDLSAGTYNYRWYANDTLGNMNSTESGSYTINKATLSASITKDTLLTKTYDETSTTIGISESNNGDGDVTYKLYVNGVDEGSSYIQATAGTYVIVLNSTGGTNYSTSANLNSETLTINKATPTGSIAGTSQINYGTAGDVIGSESNNGDGDVTYKLYREGTEVSNPDTSTLGVGTYNYIYNSTSGTNYSAVASLDTFALTVNQVSSSINLTLGGVQGNASINEDISINLNCSTISGDSGAYLVLYNNGTLINNGTSPIGNTTLFSEPGNYNITCVYENTQNYTTSSESWWLEVNDITLPTIQIQSPTNTSYNYQTIWFNATADEPIDTWIVNYNGTNQTIPINSTLEVADGSYQLLLYANDSFGNVGLNDSIWFSVDTTSPTLTILSPSNTTYYTNQLVRVNFSGTDTNDISNFWYHNGTENKTFTTEEYLNLTNNSYTFIFYANDSLNNIANYSISFTVAELSENQTILNNSTFEVRGNTTEIILPSNLSISEITIPTNINETEPITLNLGQKIDSSGNASFGTENVSLSRNSGGENYTVEIPAGTVLNGGNDWDGSFVLPTVKSTTGLSAPLISGYTTTLEKVITAGSDVEINFSKPVKLVLGGMAGKKAAWARGSSFINIPTQCVDLTDPTLNNTVRECYINSNNDLIIWTLHFTDFAAYTTEKTVEYADDTTTSSLGGIGGYPTYRPNEEELKEGYQKLMYKNWRVSFNVENISHTFKVEDVTKTNAKISISPEIQEATLFIGEEKKFELSGDDYYDVLVKLNSIDSDYISSTYFRANFTIQTMHEEIVSPQESEAGEETTQTSPESEAGEETTQTSPESEAGEEKADLTWLWVLIGVSIILILSGIGYKKLRK